jgi:hypothetical protein
MRWARMSPPSPSCHTCARRGGGRTWPVFRVSCLGFHAGCRMHHVASRVACANSKIIRLQNRAALRIVYICTLGVGACT